MSILVIAEHDNSSLKAATLNTVTAAQAIGGEITVLVAGSGCGDVATNAAKILGVNKVLVADNPAYGHRLAENFAPLIAELASGSCHNYWKECCTPCGCVAGCTANIRHYDGRKCGYVQAAYLCW